MVKLRMRAGIVPAVLAITLVAAACGGDNTDDPGDGATEPAAVSGSVAISGSSTVQPISELVAELFNETNPDVAISVDGPGTGDGFELLCQGEIDIADASRPIDEEEAAACEEAGINYVELEVGIDGLTVMTNPENEAVTCLNAGDMYALFGPESDGFANWSDANELATTVGGNGGFPDLPLEITAPGEESGTYDSFIDILGLEDIALEQGVAEDKAATLRTAGYQSSGNDNVIIQAMEGSPGALGFVGFAYAQEAGEGIKELEVDGGDGCVAPSVDTIADGSYPISRPLFIYVNTDKLADNAATQAFVDYYLTDDSLTALVGEAGYVSIPADRIEATRAAWEGAGA